MNARFPFDASYPIQDVAYISVHVWYQVRTYCCSIFGLPMSEADAALWPPRDGGIVGARTCHCCYCRCCCCCCCWLVIAVVSVLYIYTGDVKGCMSKPRASFCFSFCFFFSIVFFFPSSEFGTETKCHPTCALCRHAARCFYTYNTAGSKCTGWLSSVSFLDCTKIGLEHQPLWPFYCARSTKFGVCYQAAIFGEKIAAVRRRTAGWQQKFACLMQSLPSALERTTLNGNTSEYEGPKASSASLQSRSPKRVVTYETRSRTAPRNLGGIKLLEVIVAFCVQYQLRPFGTPRQ